MRLLKLGAYVIRRLLLAIPVLIGVTLLTFWISWEANDGHLERAYLTEKMTPDQRAAIIEAYGFDEPPTTQYLNYLKRVVTLDLGFSRVESDRPVLEVYKLFLPATLELTLVAMVVAVATGIAVGTMTAVRKDAPIDHATRFLALAGVSVPIFWLGLVLKFALATNYPEILFGAAGPVGKSLVFALAFGGPVTLGLLAAEALDPATSSWRRYLLHAAVLLAILLACVALGWTFTAWLLGLLAIPAYAGATYLKAARRTKFGRTRWRIALSVLALGAVALALSPVAGDAVKGIFDTIPDLPLGGRFSNSLLIDADAHPSLVDGPTRVLLLDTALARDWVAFRDVAEHLVLPGITLGYASLAIIARMMRASMLETLNLDFVRTARAKGLPEGQVIRAHARRNALIPIATVVGLTFGSLLSGAVLTETIFQWPGLGRWSTKAIVAGDTTSVMSFTLLVVVIYLLANFIVDMAYAVIDPRVRLE